MRVEDKTKAILIKKSKEGIESNQDTQVPITHTGVKRIDQDINKELKNIESFATKNIVNAFKKLYKVSLPVLLIIIVFMLVFWRKPKHY